LCDGRSWVHTHLVDDHGMRRPNRARSLLPGDGFCAQNEFGDEVVASLGNRS
jgi:hypothetical protein